MAAMNGTKGDGEFPPMLLLCPVCMKPYKYVTLFGKTSHQSPGCVNI